MRLNVYSWAVFVGRVNVLHSNYPDRVAAINHFWHQKTRDTAGLPEGEDCILLHSLVLPQYRSVTDRQTDGRTDLP